LSGFFNILSLAGGGARGLFQACFLENLQNDDRLKNLRFDLIIGTSTGSITAAALATGRSAREIRGIFEKNLDTIFPVNGWRLALKGISDKGPLFDINILKNVLYKEFKNKRLSDAQTSLLISGTTLDRFEPKTFSSLSPPQGASLRIVDAVAASCSAPIFFAPHKIDEQDRSYVDGGLWANNPAMAGVEYAMHELGVPAQLIRVLSLGTGEVAPGATLDEINDGRQVGITAVLRVLEMYNTSQSMRAIDGLMATLGHERVLHINPVLKSNIALHDAREAKAILPAAAQSEFESSRDKIIRVFESKPDGSSVYFDRTGLINDEMIVISGLSRFMPKRRFYQKFRQGAGDIESYLGSAQHSIEMISINLSTGNFFEDICRVITKKLEIPGFQVRISLLDPDDSHLMDMISAVFAREREESKSERLSESIARSMAKLQEVRGALTHNQRSRFILGFHHSLPFGSAIILDEGFASARIQIETKPYKAPMSDSFAFELVPSNDEALYHTLLESYRALMADGRVC
jgi:uncharacterized protein